jgi:hypothetical protein
MKMKMKTAAVLAFLRIEWRRVRHQYLQPRELPARHHY